MMEQTTARVSVSVSPAKLTVDVEKERETRIQLIDNLCMMARAFVSSNINLKDFNGNTALHYAATKEDVEWVNFFLKKGADTRVRNNDGNTALHMAAEKNEGDNFYRIAKELLENDTKNPNTQPRSLANVKNNLQETPFHVLLKKPKVGKYMVELFLNYKADIFARSVCGLSPVMMAEHLDDREAAELITEQLERRFFEVEKLH